MFGFCQAGLVINLNDGISWGVLPLLSTADGLAVDVSRRTTAPYRMESTRERWFAA
jgi:hypothetical protein